MCAQKTGRKRHGRLVRSTEPTKKLRNVKTASSVQTSDIVEDSCFLEVNDDQPQMTNEIRTSITTGEKATKNKSQLSEMDSGILIEDVEDDTIVGQTARRKVSSQGANVKRESLVTLAKVSQSETSSSTCNAHTSHMMSVTSSNQRSVGTLHAKSSECSSVSPDSLAAVSGDIPRDTASQVDVTDVKQLPEAKIESEVLRKAVKRRGVKQQPSEKKCATKKANKQPRLAASFTRYGDSHNAIESDKSSLSDEVFVISSDDDDDDELSSATSQMAPGNSHIGTGIVVYVNIYQPFL